MKMIKAVLLFFILTIILTSKVWASTRVSPDIITELEKVDQTPLGKQFWGFLYSNCNQVEMKNIEDVPINWSKPLGSKFTYFFKYHRNISSDVTIIFLPGGPGGAGSMIDVPHIEEFNYIKIDPRGLGCNYYDSKILPAEVIDTKSTALDIVEVIRRLGLKKYVIYGASYGTVLGTIVENELQSSGLPLPLALVLEGTLGKEIDLHHNYTDAYIKLWEQLKSQNSFITNLFSDSLPYAGSKLAWGFLISSGFENDSVLLLENLKLLNKKVNGTISESEQIQLDQYVSEFLKEPSSFSTELLEFGGLDRVLRQIICTELSQDWYYHTFILEGDTLSAVKKSDWPSANLCSNSSSYKGYDSRFSRVKVPIYYFQGTSDPQTPLDSAAYHFKNQTQSPFKLFQEVKGAGHRPTRTRLRSCMSQIWQRVFTTQDFSGILNSDGNCLTTN